MRMLDVDEVHLELGSILLVWVHFSPNKVSHARNNMIYPNDMIPIASNQIYVYVKDMFWLSSSFHHQGGVVDTWP